MVHVSRGDGDEALNPVRVIAGLSAGHQPLRALEQVVHRRGWRVGEDEIVEVVDRLGARQLSQGEVALDASGARLERDADDAGEGGDERRCRQTDRQVVAADEFSCPVGDRIRPGGDRLVRKVATKIVGEGGHRGVALGRILLQRLEDDGVEIPSQRAAELGGRGDHFGGPQRLRVDNCLD